MGMYNTYGNVQLKVGDELTLSEFGVGDEVDIPDGVYVGYEGVVVIIDGKLAKVFPTLLNKYGGEYNIEEIIPNPLKDIVEEVKKRLDEEKEMS